MKSVKWKRIKGKEAKMFISGERKRKNLKAGHVWDALYPECWEEKDTGNQPQWKTHTHARVHTRVNAHKTKKQNQAQGERRTEKDATSEPHCPEAPSKSRRLTVSPHLSALPQVPGIQNIWASYHGAWWVLILSWMACICIHITILTHSCIQCRLTENLSQTHSYWFLLFIRPFLSAF